MVAGLIIGMAIAFALAQSPGSPLTKLLGNVVERTSTTTVTVLYKETVPSPVTVISTKTVYSTVEVPRYITLTHYRTHYYTETRYVTRTLHHYYTYTVTYRPALLLPVDLEYRDERPLFRTPKLIIYGYIVNIGDETAYDVTLRVYYYQGNVKSVKEIEIGTISERSWRKVDVSIPYTGDRITSVIIEIIWRTPSGVYRTVGYRPQSS